MENHSVALPSNREMGILNISAIFQSCNNVVNYLMSDWRDKSIKSPTPYHNPFNRFVFRNLPQYIKNTEIIPENVVEEI
ncbi:MAG: hypothetical protein HPY66_1190 [Firmicutes bacterium]|nr:hypothetical protein [Bacillota bacterium]MDI6705496.1 hypothetical protein [Bacillota bacterium]